ncbi:MAG: MFS transporter, partial [Microbacterium sp. 14-71-5]
MFSRQEEALPPLKTGATSTVEVEPRNGLDRFFSITRRGSTVGREIRGGIVTFVTMAYIVILNPLILGGTKDVAGHALDAAQIGAATGLTAGVMTILFGVIARLPFALAAGLGINSFLAVAVVGQVTWAEAMGLVVINGILIVLFGATGIRTAIFHAVPQPLKAAITVGIGLFIAFIGFVDSGFVNRTAGPGGPPVQLGNGGSITSVPTLIFLLGLVVIGILVARKVPGGILIGIVATTVVALIAQAVLQLGPSFKDPNGWHMTIPELPSSLVTIPDFSLVGQFDLFGAFGRVGALSATMLVFTLVFSNFFDAMGTMTGLAKEADLADEKGDFPRIKSALVVEGVGAIVGGGTSSSSATVFVESGAGIGEGARTGLATTITGALFLLAMFFTPLTALVPSAVAAAALVLVGAMMLSQIRNIDLSDFRVLLPVFLTVTVMPMT